MTHPLRLCDTKRPPVVAIMVKAPAAGRSKTRLGREIGMVPAAWWARHQLARLAQGPGDLGDRMARVFRALPGPTLIVGADIPGITQAHIAAGFAALGSHDAVLGPAPDGGYWAIGLKRGRPLPPRLFDGVRWSSPDALAGTLATLDGRRIAFLAPLHDVDTAADLKRVSH